MIEAAKGGDTQAGRIILERVLAGKKRKLHHAWTSDVTKAAELPGAIAAVNRQVAEGDISPDEGSLIVGLLEAQRRAIETSELAVRVAAIEEWLGPQ